MTKFSAYPEGGVTDALAFRVEAGLAAYVDGQLSLKQLATFIGKDEMETLAIMKHHGVEYVRDEDWLAEELEGMKHAATFVKHQLRDGRS